LGSWAKKLAGALAALALTAAPVAAQVPDPFARELAQKLARGEQLLTDDGYSRAAGPFAGGLNANSARRNTVMLRAGQDYRILGVCDHRCADLDLRVFGPNGALVSQDILEDAVPIVRIQPLATGQYQIEAIMARCTGAPCWYAFNVYSR
jgi:hypothetical protein